MTDVEVKLKPCPFSGKEPNPGLFEADDIGGWVVSSGHCQVWGETEAAAIETWNTRTAATEREHELKSSYARGWAEGEKAGAEGVEKIAAELEEARADLDIALSKLAVLTDEEGSRLLHDDEELEALIARQRNRLGDAAFSEWTWWARDCDHEPYAIEQPTREGVIAAALHEWGRDGSVEAFEIIEARQYADAVAIAVTDHDGDEAQPFVQERNNEWISTKLSNVLTTDAGDS